MHLHEWVYNCYGVNVGKYTVRPMDPMGLISVLSLFLWKMQVMLHVYSPMEHLGLENNSFTWIRI